MAEVQTRICDFTNCRRLADGQCGICGRDACSGHLSGKLVFAMNVSQVLDNAPSVSLCGECRAFVDHSDIGRAILKAFKHDLEALLTAIVAELKPLWAAEALAPSDDAQRARDLMDRAKRDTEEKLRGDGDSQFSDSQFSPRYPHLNKKF